MSSLLLELPDTWVALNPPDAYRYLAQQPWRAGLWTAIRRPLFVALILGCDITLIAADPFRPRLVASAAIYWCFVPLAELLALTIVCWRARTHLSLSKSIELFFTGHALWLLWFTLISFIWSLQAPYNASSFTFHHIVALVAGSIAVAIWSSYIDFCFFRFALGWSKAGAVLGLVLQRLLSWALIFLAFSWASLSSALSGP